MMKELDSEGYEELRRSPIPVVLEFYSSTCPHCRRTEMEIRELEEEQEMQNVIFAKCCVESQLMLARRLDVKSLPTLLFLKDGQIKNRKVGFTHKQIIQAEVERLK